MAPKMRGHGEGSIRQRGPELWEARVTLGYREGRLARRSLYGSTRKEVADKMSAVLAGLQRGDLPLSERRTVGTFLEEWMAGLDLRVRPSTAERYCDLLRRHAIPSIGKVRLGRLTPQRVDALLADRQRAGLSPRSVWHLRAVLRAALGDAMRTGEVTRNVAALARPPKKVEPYHVEPMSPDQAAAILDAVAGTALEAPVSVALWTGLRQGELLGLRWSDIDLDRGRLTVAVTLQRRHREWSVEGTKTEKSRRTISLPAPAVDALTAWRHHQREQRLRGGPGWETRYGDLVFTNTIGQPLQGTTLSHQFREALERAGLRSVRFHDLRHGAATLMLASGTDLKVVSEVLGHSTIATTANVYAGVLDSLKADAATRLTRLVRPGSA